MTEIDFHPDLINAKKEDIYYNLVMFPYPSGYGLHAGHASNFTIIDINARFHRMLGKTVFNPFGFDSFGLPTENYAMKVGKPAYEVIKENSEYFLKQLKALNISFDYDRMVYTSNPDYYKWTQWIFMKLYEHGLVYRDELYVNWCPECQTVLANDQVVDGKCERCKSEIIQKKHPQWFIKITDYADRLIKDLELIDRPKETKIGQKNRIGRSTGAEIDFAISQSGQNEVTALPTGMQDLESKTITCFTTRPDTIYGVTALVLAPENTDIDHLIDKQKKKEVEKYRQQALAKTAVQRQQDAKEKTGVFSGIYAKHPLTNEDIPIRFADYVLADYGSGAVMIVPAHDQRDREFATKFDIPIKQVISSGSAELDRTKIVKEGKTNFYGGSYFGIYLEANNKKKALDELIQTIEEENLNQITIYKKEYSNIKEIRIRGSMEQLITLCKKQNNLKTKLVTNGRLINSGTFNEIPSKEAIKKITAHLESLGKGRAKVTYKLRDRSVSRQRYRGSPIPIYYTEYKSTLSPLFVAEGDAAPQSLAPQQTRESVGAIIYHTEEQKYIFIQRKANKEIWMVHGGIENGQTLEEAVKTEIQEETGYTNITKTENLHHICRFQRYVPHKGINRDGYAHLFYAEVTGKPDQQKKEDKEKLDVLLIEEKNIQNTIAKDPLMQYAWNFYTTNKNKKEIPENSIKIPHLIPEDELPVKLPLDVKNYKPKGKSPLADHPTFPIYKDKHGNESQRECDTLDTFVCSSFYFLRYPDANNPNELIREELRDKMFPIDFYCGGKEHTVGHLLYSRFIHKFLYDIGYVSSPEPFQKLVHQGMVLGPDGRKMGKRRGNVIDPLHVIEKYSADVLRTYLMFMGPVESDKARDDNGVKGIQKFLQRIEKLRIKGKIYQDKKFTKLSKTEKEKGLQQLEATLHKIIRDITDDMHKMKYNTAVSKLMILVNKIYEIGSAKKEHLEKLTIMLAPFATDLATSMRKDLGHDDNIHYQPRPSYDENKILAESIDLPVQFNGKMRGTISIYPGTDQDTILQAIKSEGKRDNYLDGEIKKIIFIQDKIINIIVKS